MFTNKNLRTLQEKANKRNGIVIKTVIVLVKNCWRKGNNISYFLRQKWLCLSHYNIAFIM